MTDASNEVEKQEAPLELYAREAQRVGYLALDARSLLYGYLLGREWPATPERVRQIAEQMLSDRRGPHLPRPDDEVESAERRAGPA